MIVRDIATGEEYKVQILRVKNTELKKVKKKDGWNFDWSLESKYEVYKLVLENMNEPPGLISLADGMDDNYIEVMHLEAAPQNIGKNKKYDFVAGILMAHSCQLSFDRGYEGWVTFESKTTLKKHYAKAYGAKDTGMRCMYINTPAAHKLVANYLYPKI